jgi:hypothetical protein
MIKLKGSFYHLKNQIVILMKLIMIIISKKRLEDIILEKQCSLILLLVIISIILPIIYLHYLASKCLVLSYRKKTHHQANHLDKKYWKNNMIRIKSSRINSSSEKVRLNTINQPIFLNKNQYWQVNSKLRLSQGKIKLISSIRSQGKPKIS